MVEVIKRNFQLVVTVARERIRSMSVINWIIVALVVLFCGLVVQEFIKERVFSPGVTTVEATTLEVIKIELVSPKKVRIAFSEEVDQHELAHHLLVSSSIDGNVNGKILDGKDGKEFFFENAEDFPLATTLRVQVTAGVVSKKGLLLPENRTYNLQTNISSKQVTFQKDGIFGRVLTGAPGVPIPIEIKSGEDIYNPTITIYKSTQADLLNYLLYSEPETPQIDKTYRSSSSKFKSHNISHPKSAKIESFETKDTQKKTFTLESGIYYLEATKKEFPVGSTFLIVSKVGIIFRQDDKKIILSAFDTKTGQKISESVDAGFYDLQDSPKLLERTVFTNLVTIPAPFEKKLDVILATVGNETVLVPVKIKESLADIRVNKNLDNDLQMFIYTDRPIYKPGDTVFYRGTVRTDNDALYKLPKEGMKVRILTDAKLKHNLLVDVDKNGLFSGNFVIPKDVVGDFQQISVTLAETAEDRIDPDNYATAYFAVKKYEKPTFELTLATDKEEYYRHEKVVLKIKGTYFNSDPLGGEKIDYALYNTSFFEQEKKVYNQNFNITQAGGMCGGGGFGDYYGELLKKGNVNLNTNGEREIVIDLKKVTLPLTSQTITFTASKKDNKSNNIIQSAIKAIVHAGAYSIFFIPSPTQYVTGEEMIVPFYIESSVSGDNPPKELEYDVRTTKYESDKSKEVILASGKVSLTDGKGIIKQKAPSVENGSVSIVVKAQDANGNKIEGSKWLSVSKARKDDVDVWWQGRSPTQTYLKIISDSNSYVVGDTIKLNINSPKDLDVFLSPERGRMYETKIIHLNKGENTLEIPVTNEMSPSIILTFSFFVDGKYYSEGVTLNVPAMHKLLHVQIEKDKDTYKPNETANLTVTIKDVKGNPVSGVFSLGVVDEAIYGLRKDATPLVHSSFYYFRGRSTNASSSLTMIGSYLGGGGGGGGGGGIDGKLIDTLFWAPTLKTDANGKAVIPVKLNDALTIWRAQVIASDDQTDLGQSSIKIQVKD